MWLAFTAVTPAILPTLSQIAPSQPSQCMPFTVIVKATGAVAAVESAAAVFAAAFDVPTSTGGAPRSPLHAASIMLKTTNEIETRLELRMREE
jgi:hypothetical protein